MLMPAKSFADRIATPAMALRASTMHDGLMDYSKTASPAAPTSGRVRNTSSEMQKGMTVSTRWAASLNATLSETRRSRRNQWMTVSTGES
jgi:hypothetical protein